MQNAADFKSTKVSRPTDTVAIVEVSGSFDPAQINGPADAAWLDTVWAGNSGPTFPFNGENGRVQTAYAKHNGRLNFIYVDGHAAASKPSAITWGQFFGVFQAGASLPTSGTTQVADKSISQPGYDFLEWSTTPE